MIHMSTFNTMNEIKGLEQIIENSLRTISETIQQTSKLDKTPAYPYTFKSEKFEIVFGIMATDMKSIEPGFHMYATNEKNHPPVVLINIGNLNLINNALIIDKPELVTWFYKNLSDAVDAWVNELKTKNLYFDTETTSIVSVTKTVYFQLEIIRKATEIIKTLFEN